MTPPSDDSPNPKREESTGISRRSFLKGAGGAAAGGVLAGRLSAEPEAAVAPTPAIEKLEGSIELVLDINGAKQKIQVEPRTTLLNALRNHVQPTLTGTKLVCDEGTCGACTVIMDGKPRYSCLTLAADAVGSEVRTVEGLANGADLTPVQEAFCEHDALMCGFCTPGFVMSITAALEKNPLLSDEELKKACAGNFCRCGTYPHIFEAAKAAAVKMREQGGR